MSFPLAVIEVSLLYLCGLATTVILYPQVQLQSVVPQYAYCPQTFLYDTYTMSIGQRSFLHIHGRIGFVDHLNADLSSDAAASTR